MNSLELKTEDAITITVSGPPKSGKSKLVEKIKESVKYSPGNILVVEEVPKSEKDYLIRAKMIHKYTNEIVFVQSFDDTLVEYRGEYSSCRTFLETKRFLEIFVPYVEEIEKAESLFGRFSRWLSSIFGVKPKKSVSPWRTEYRCVNCHDQMSFSTKMHSNGRCPNCGVKESSAGTIVRCYEVPYRLERTAPKWKFWIKSVKCYKEDRKTLEKNPIKIPKN